MTASQPHDTSSQHKDFYGQHVTEDELMWVERRVERWIRFG